MMTAEGIPHNIKIQRTVLKIPDSSLCLMPAADAERKLTSKVPH